MSVAEATRNVAITGARPLGVTNCLNYGDPTRPEAFWQLQEGVRGLGDACRALGLPVTGGNVSLYNESPGGAIAPTARDRRRRPARRRRARSSGRRSARPLDTVLLVGETTPGLAGSAYAGLAGVAVEDGPPALDLAREAALQRVHPRGHRARARGSAPRTCPAAAWPWPWPRARCGAASAPSSACRSPTRRRSSCSARARRGSSSRRRPRFAPALTLLARQHGLPVEELGIVGGDRLVIELAGAGATGAAEERGSRVADALEVPLADLRHAWDHGLARALGWEGDA